MQSIPFAHLRHSMPAFLETHLMPFLRLILQVRIFRASIMPNILCVLLLPTKPRGCLYFEGFLALSTISNIHFEILHPLHPVSFQSGEQWNRSISHSVRSELPTLTGCQRCTEKLNRHQDSRISSRLSLNSFIILWIVMEP